jgi:hypothetical protein
VADESGELVVAEGSELVVTEESSELVVAEGAGETEQ